MCIISDRYYSRAPVLLQYLKGLTLVLENGHYSLKRTNKLTPSFHLKSAHQLCGADAASDTVVSPKKIVVYWSHADGMHCYYYNHSTAKGVLRALPLEKLMKAFCNRNGVASNSVRFLFDGNRVNPTQTPQDLDMEDGDVIDVMVEQQGGGAVAAAVAAAACDA